MDESAELTSVFDVHAHLPPGEEALRKLLRVMDTLGIERAVVVGGVAVNLELISRQMVEGGETDIDADNKSVMEAYRKTDGKLLPFYWANPHRGPDPYRREAPRFRGLKLAPSVQGVRLDDERTVALVEVAKEAEHPVYSHVFNKEGFNVKALVKLAEHFPTVRFILGHAGIMSLDFYGTSLIAPYPNVMLETSAGFTSVVEDAIGRLGPHRVMFGTDYPTQHPSVELEKFRVLNLPQEVREQVLWKNACRLVGEAES